MPTVIGWLKPTVLLPVSALAGLSPQQLEAILAHELAHVRRHDYLVNLLQTLRRDAAVLSPRRVVAVAPDPRSSARTAATTWRSASAATRLSTHSALADLEELRGPGLALAMAANGGALLEPRPAAAHGPAQQRVEARHGSLATSVALLVLAIIGGIGRTAVIEGGVAVDRIVDAASQVQVPAVALRFSDRCDAST